MHRLSSPGCIWFQLYKLFSGQLPTTTTCCSCWCLLSLLTIPGFNQLDKSHLESLIKKTMHSQSRHQKPIESQSPQEMFLQIEIIETLRHILSIGDLTISHSFKL